MPRMRLVYPRAVSHRKRHLAAGRHATDSALMSTFDNGPNVHSAPRPLKRRRRDVPRREWPRQRRHDIKTGEMEFKSRVTALWCDGRIRYLGRLAARGEREPKGAGVKHRWSLSRLADKLSITYGAAVKRWQRYKRDRINAIAAEQSEAAADRCATRRKGRPGKLTDMIRQMIGNCSVSCVLSAPACYRNVTIATA